MATTTEEALRTLQTTFNNVSTLLTRLQSALAESSSSTSSPSPTPAVSHIHFASKLVPSSDSTASRTPPAAPASSATSKPPPNPLFLLTTASTLLRAQTTKLSLLALNKPHTPSALTSTLSTYVQILPSLVAGAQQIAAAPNPESRFLFPHFFAAEVVGRVGAVLNGLKGLLEEIPLSEEAATVLHQSSSSSSRGTTNTGRADTLRGTGLVWEECDYINELGVRGVRGLADEKVRGWGALLGDVVEEMEEWMEGGDSDDEHEGEEDDDDDDDGDDDEVEGKMSNMELDDGLDELLGETPFKEELRPLATETVETLKMVKMLFPPVLKRRLGRLVRIDQGIKWEDMPGQEVQERLEWLVGTCKALSEEADEIVAGLYGGDKSVVEARLGAIRQRARGCAKGMGTGWSGEEDEFTDWVGKWEAKLEQVGKA